MHAGDRAGLVRARLHAGTHLKVAHVAHVASCRRFDRGISGSIDPETTALDEPVM